MRKKKFILYVTMIAAAAGINLSACSSGTGAEQGTAALRSSGQGTGSVQSSIQGTDVSKAPGQETPGEGGTKDETISEHTLKSESARNQENARNQKDAEGPVLRLELPEDQGLCSDPSFIQQDDNTIQILFHDETTQSDAIAWASLEAAGGPSENYVLDQQGMEQREILAGEDGPVVLTIRKTVENSDIHGILISWEQEGVFYELWEDDAREKKEAVVDMASAIASRSRLPL